MGRKHILFWFGVMLFTTCIYFVYVGIYIGKEDSSVEYIDTVFKEEGMLDKINSSTSYVDVKEGNSSGAYEELIYTYTRLDNSGYGSLSNSQKIILFEDQSVVMLGEDVLNEYERLKPSRFENMLLRVCWLAFIIPICALFIHIFIFNKYVEGALNWLLGKIGNWEYR